uniref:MraY family glycosyltransferase n=1 Tax=Pedobacter schmidteae TaxID=2201271 RepID=UPI000EAE331C|nr:MraY family glycosyltransferase [Pedobacter schmidteae]
MINYFHHYQMLYYLLTVLSSLSITLLVIPSIIHVARTRHLYDDLGNLRKIHNPGIPRLGGVAIFVSFTITLLLFGIDHPMLPLKYILTSCIMLFAIGIKDDLAGVGHRSKFLIEFIAAWVLVIPGNIRLSNLHNLFGIYQLNDVSSICVSIVLLLFIINAFNLIDGIDGLAATTGIVAHSMFSALFIQLHQYELATVSLSLAGAILGFLKFNITPAKVFMGDTGSLLIGLISGVMALQYITISGNLQPEPLAKDSSALGLVLAILIGPVSDTLRVFIIRLAKGKSPFLGDRNHIHHRILKLGFNHLQTTLILVLLNGLIILLAFSFADYGNTVMIILVATTLILFNWLLTYFVRSKERDSYRLKNLFL